MIPPLAAPAQSIAAEVMRGIYRKPLTYFCEKYGLRTHGGEVVSECASVTNGLVFAEHEEVPGPASTAPIVGGVCVDHCEGVLERLSVSIYPDIVVPLRLGAALNRRVILILPIAEAVLASPRRGLAWQGVGDRVEALVAHLAATYQHPRVDVVRTDRVRIDRRIAAAVDQYRPHLDSMQLRGLFAVASSGAGGRSTTAARVKTFHRTLVGYLPSVLSELTCEKCDDILVVENAQQLRAVAAARNLRNSGGLAGTLGHLVYPPAPSMSGRSRMSRAMDRTRIMVGEPSDQSLRKLRGASSSSKEYWLRLWQIGRLDEPAVADRLTELRKVLVG